MCLTILDIVIKAGDGSFATFDGLAQKRHWPVDIAQAGEISTRLEKN
jgi:hypothetical protein